MKPIIASRRVISQIYLAPDKHLGMIHIVRIQNFPKN